MDEVTLRRHLDDDGLLDPSGLDLGDADLEGWGSLPWLANAVSLDLSENDLTDAALELLVGCEHLRGLEVLDLGWNELGERVGGQVGALHRHRAPG